MKSLKQKDKAVKRLYDARSKYDGVVGSIESELSDYIDFDFSITYHHSDGFAIVAFDNCAPLESCIDVILQSGLLTASSFLKICI